MSEWLVCFVPPTDRRIWHKLCHRKHKHCFAIKDNGDGKWTLFEPWWTRIMVETIDTKRALGFLTWARRGDALRVPQHDPGISSQLRGWMSCAALIAHMLGRSYQTWTPHQLYRRLLREPDVERVDVTEIISSLKEPE